MKDECGENIAKLFLLIQACPKSMTQNMGFQDVIIHPCSNNDKVFITFKSNLIIETNKRSIDHFLRFFNANYRREEGLFIETPVQLVDC